MGQQRRGILHLHDLGVVLERSPEARRVDLVGLVARLGVRLLLRAANEARWRTVGVEIIGGCIGRRIRVAAGDRERLSLEQYTAEAVIDPGAQDELLAGVVGAQLDL